MYPRRTLIVVGLLAFLISLLALAPVRQLLRLAPEPVVRQVQDPSGTLWSGSARITTGRGVFTVNWDSHPWRLLMAQLAADWTLTGDDVRLAGAYARAPWGHRLEVRDGELGPGRLNRLLGGTRARVDQPLLVSGVDLEVAPDLRVERAGGRLAWGPGAVNLSGRPEPFRVPALGGTLRAVDGGLRVLVDSEAGPGELLATLDLRPADNVLHLAVTQRAALLVGIPPSAGAGPDTPLLELRQPLR